MSGPTRPSRCRSYRRGSALREPKASRPSRSWSPWSTHSRKTRHAGWGWGTREWAQRTPAPHAPSGVLLAGSTTASREVVCWRRRSEDDVGELFLVQMPEILPAYLPTKDPGGSAGASEAGPAPVRGRGIPVRMETAPKSRLGTLVEYSDGTVGLRVGDVGARAGVVLGCPWRQLRRKRICDYELPTVSLCFVGAAELEVSPATLSGVQQEAVTFSVEDHVCLFLG